MSNQKVPSRPWFSFASLTRLNPAPAPASAPVPASQPRPSLARPTLRPAPQPTPPAPTRNAVAPQATQPAPASRPAVGQVPNASIEQKPQPSNIVSAPTTRKEVSPRAPPRPNITTTAVMARAVTPTSSREVVKASSTNILSQPPKLKAANEKPNIPAVSEQKNVISQKTIEKPKPHNNNTKGYGVRHSGFEDDDYGMRVVTMAGESKGAVMEVHPLKKHGFRGHEKFLYNNKTDSIHSEGSESENLKKSNKANKMRSLPMRAFVNSNVQGINNSIVYNTSFSHHDPGIHLGLTKKPSNKEESGGW